MESNLLFGLLTNQKIIGLWEDMRLLVGNTKVQNKWKYTSRVLIFCSIFIAVLIREQVRQPWKDQEIQKTR